MKIGIFYIFSSFLFMISGCHTDENKCVKLKRVEFYYKAKILLTGSIINRNDSIQIVTDEQTGEKHNDKIECTAACTYEMYPVPHHIIDILNSDLYTFSVTELEVTKL